MSMSDKEVSSHWEQQRIFGAGSIRKRKRIDFVPAAADPTQAIQLVPQPTLYTSPGDRYLKIVLKNGMSSEGHNTTSTEVAEHETIATHPPLDLKRDFCGVCNLPIDVPGDATSTAFTNHESTIAHMVCLTHSHPPSHLDRSRQGLKYLASYGWDPDRRQGLGATGEGIRAPIKAKVKNDTVGLGVELKRNKKKPPDAEVERMDAKQVRKKDMEDRRKRERLQEMFYSNDDVEYYLGGG